MWYLITWTTHGYWLQGNPRGFRTRKGKRHIPSPARFAAPGEKPYSPEQHERLYELQRKQTPLPVTLSPSHLKLILGIIADTMKELCGEYGVVSIDTHHVHAAVDLRITPGQRPGASVSKFCQFAKGRSAKALNREGVPGKIWARGYHARRLQAGHVQSAIDYVKHHSDQGGRAVEVYSRPE